MAKQFVRLHRVVAVVWLSLQAGRKWTDKVRAEFRDRMAEGMEGQLEGRMGMYNNTHLESKHLANQLLQMLFRICHFPKSSLSQLDQDRLRAAKQAAKEHPWHMGTMDMMNAIFRITALPGSITDVILHVEMQPKPHAAGDVAGTFGPAAGAGHCAKAGKGNGAKTGAGSSHGAKTGTRAAAGASSSAGAGTCASAGTKKSRHRDSHPMLAGHLDPQPQHPPLECFCRWSASIPKHVPGTWLDPEIVAALKRPSSSVAIIAADVGAKNAGCGSAASAPTSGASNAGDPLAEFPQYKIADENLPEGAPPHRTADLGMPSTSAGAMAVCRSSRL